MKAPCGLPGSRSHRRLSRRSATAACELAILLPVVSLALLGLMDLSRASGVYLAVSNAARAGAEQGATERFNDYTRATWEEHIRAAANDEMQGLPDFDPASLQVEIEPALLANDEVRVGVEVTYPFSFAIEWPGFSHLTITRKVYMHRIR